MASLNSVKFRLKIRQVLWIGLGWMLMGALDAVFIHAVSDNLLIQRAEAYRFLPLLLSEALGFGISGLITGAVLIFYLKDKFQDRSFFFFFGLSAALILVIATGMNILGNLLYHSQQLRVPIFHPDNWAVTLRGFLNPINLKTFTYGLLLVLGTVIAIQVNEKYGPGVFIKLLSGKYHRPRIEERIFMFLDMKSSTTIAEQIGHIQFHNLLREFFQDVTDPILYRQGEIYQYVGDEVVVSWTMENGLEDGNCLRCFFDMKRAIQARRSFYEHAFGLVPDFKAGLHSGEVTTGEIGVVEKGHCFLRRCA